MTTYDEQLKKESRSCKKNKDIVTDFTKIIRESGYKEGYKDGKKSNLISSDILTKQYNLGYSKGCRAGYLLAQEDILKIIKSEILNEQDAIDRNAKRDWDILKELNYLIKQIQSIQ